jgi:hypothetical protein
MKTGRSAAVRAGQGIAGGYWLDCEGRLTTIGRDNRQLITGTGTRTLDAAILGIGATGGTNRELQSIKRDAGGSAAAERGRGWKCRQSIT